MITILSLLRRSASTPPYSESSSTGKLPAALTTPTRNALLVSSSASQPCPTVCIQVPMSDTVCPVQNILKLRWTCSVLNGLTERGRARGGVSLELDGVEGALGASAIPERIIHLPGPRLYVLNYALPH